MDATQIRQQLQAALEGVVPDPGAVVDDLDLTRFADEAGEVNGAAVEALAERYRGLAGSTPKKGRAAGLAEADRRFGGNRSGGKNPASGREQGLAEARRRFGPPPDAA